MSDLLPCPFCGEVAVQIAHLGTTFRPWSAQCEDCRAEMCASDRDEVITAWNRRAPTASPHHTELGPGKTPESAVSVTSVDRQEEGASNANRARTGPVARPETDAEPSGQGESK